MADGTYELAASLLESTGARFDHRLSVADAERLVYLKLIEKYQNTDPFKFIIYSGRIGEQTTRLAVPNSSPGNAVSRSGEKGPAPRSQRATGTAKRAVRFRDRLSHDRTTPNALTRREAK